MIHTDTNLYWPVKTYNSILIHSRHKAYTLSCISMVSLHNKVEHYHDGQPSWPRAEDDSRQRHNPNIMFNTAFMRKYTKLFSNAFKSSILSRIFSMKTHTYKSI